MKTVEQLEAELRNKTAEMKALNGKADFNADDQTKYDGLKAEAVKVEAELARARDLREWELKAPAIQSVPAPASADIKVGKELWENDPKKGFKSHVDFLMEVMKVPAMAPAKSARDERLKFLATAGSDEQSTFADPYGGFLVPTSFLPGFLSTGTPSDPISALTRKIPMATPTVEINARVDKTHSTSVSGGLRVYRRAEADTVSSSRMEVEQVKLEATALMGIAYATEELLSRSPVSFAALISQGFNDEFGSRMLYERLSGTGVGQFRGINNADCKIDVAKEGGQAAATIVYNNIIKMRARVWGYQNAVWVANQTVIPQLALLNMTVGTGGVPVWMSTARMDIPTDMLLGRPLVFTEYCSALGTVGDIVCVNWNEYLEGTLTPLQSAESMHVRFVNHERTYKFWMENAGQPWWRSALAPKNGDTLSPIVRLATRG